MAFVPGQFFTVLVPVEGEVLRRAYSISAGATDGRVSITVKKIEGGRVSARLVDGAVVGMRLQVLGPSGEFTVAPDATAARHLVAIAGGSGITPIMSIVRSVLAVEARSRVTLLYGNRTEASVIFAAELARMEAGSGGRLVVKHVIEAREGRLDAAAAPMDGDAYYVCGPEAMMAAARAALLAGGVDGARIREEKFSSPARRQAAQVEVAQPVTIRRGGVTLDVIVPAGATLLDAGLAAGVPMALSCAMGGCGACAVTLTAGEVVMDEPNCLGPDERARGTILACVARPLSPCTVEVKS
jgi:ferredoxin-NADP reductase